MITYMQYTNWSMKLSSVDVLDRLLRWLAIFTWTKAPTRRDGVDALGWRGHLEEPPKMCRYLTGKTVGPWCFLMVPVRCRLHPLSNSLTWYFRQVGLLELLHQEDLEKNAACLPPEHHIDRLQLSLQLCSLETLEPSEFPCTCLMDTLISMWRFPEMGAPQNHPFYFRMFHSKPFILGYPHLWNPPCW